MVNQMIYLFIEKKRDIFDRFGEEGLKQGGGNAAYTFSGDPHVIFSQMFGGASPFGDLFNGGGTGTAFFAGPNGFSGLFGGKVGNNGFDDMDFTPSGGFSTSALKQDKAVHHDLNVTLEELYQGCTKRMKISRRILSADGSSRNEEKVLEIVVKPGWKEGTKITFSKEGDQYLGRIPADIVFTIKEKLHAHFKRDGNNLNYTARISLKDALCGVKVNIPRIDTTVTTQNFQKVLSPQTVERIPGGGMPISKEPGSYGDLLVKFDIIFPSILGQKDQQILKSILP